MTEELSVLVTVVGLLSPVIAEESTFMSEECSLVVSFFTFRAFVMVMLRKLILSSQESRTLEALKNGIE